MKVSDLLTGDWKVKVFTTGKVAFAGAKVDCIKFIAGFDRASSKYVDLRLHDKKDQEFDYHKNTYVEAK